MGSEIRMALDGQLIVVQAPSDRKQRSCFSDYFMHENGVISISLKALTLTGTISVLTALFIMLYIACRDNMVSPEDPADNCSFRHHHPMVSDVICLPFFDRIWCILTTFFSYTVTQTNIRAFYKRFHGIIPVEDNNTMMFWGWAIVFSFPLIGYFDEHNYATLHFTLAGIFFTSSTIYLYKLGNRFYDHKEKFPQLSSTIINWMKFQGRLLIFFCVVFFISFVFEFYIPLWEWILGVSYINQFTFTAFINPFYECIHPRKN